MASSSTSPQLGNSASIVEELETGNVLHQSEHAAGRGSCDIFLSHSGAQKGFAKGLNHMLFSSYNVFFDINHHCLPLAEDFPSRILYAAKTCKLALVVLSNEFLSSKWPMIELSAFTSSRVKILPLFYELSPQDLKDKAKLEEWRKRWEEFASKDGRIKVSSWAHALHRLSSLNGLIFRKSDGELAYLDEIVSDIYRMIPPLLKFSHDGIHGRDRLCKVLIDKFEELERRPLHPSASPSKVYLLGVYGLPGSGKSTLCACLRDHFFSAFAGRALHLKLPTNPTPTELLASAKELLKLTDYGHYREEMVSNIGDLPQMYNFLKTTNLRSSRVFLVIDNISSQESIESVAAILQFGIGAGSRVMLVARTLEVLHSLLNIPTDCQGQIHYVRDSIRVPSIDEKEAVCVLMQSADGLGSASDHVIKMEEKLNSSHREIIVKLVRMWAFCTHPPHHDDQQDLLYLPLALKFVGSQLRRNGMDLAKWQRRALELEIMVKELKEDAVRMMVEESFQGLEPKELKLVFLDVALFMVPYYGFLNIEYEAAAELLSFMHERHPDTIKRQVKELIRLCFLELGSSSAEESIAIHDVFLEFAKSIADASSMYYCRRTMAGVQVRSDLCRIVRKSSVDLRALILEVDEKCEKFDFPAGLSSVRVVVVRNCKSLGALGLAGLTSLVSLEVQECPKLTCVEFDPCHAFTLKSLKWAKRRACKDRSDQQLQGSFLQSLLQKLQAGSGVQVKQLLKKGWHGMWDFGGYWPQRPLNGSMSLASRLQGLQVLRLEGSGITSLGDLSSYWPQLRALEVFEDHLEHLDLGNLPNLKRFFLGDEDREGFDTPDNLIRLYKEASKHKMSKKPNLLAGCPELEDVRICKPSCEDGMGMLVVPSPNLRKFWLKHIHFGEPVLPDITASAHLLEEIHVWDHWVLQSIELTYQFSSLAQIWLWKCPNLVTITGLECLPNLRDLRIVDCAKLQSLGNLEAVRKLEGLQLFGCPALILTLRGLRSLEFLASISVSHGCQNVQFFPSDLENLTALRYIECNAYVSMFKLQNLVNLEHLQLTLAGICEGQAAHELSLCGSLNGEADRRHVNNSNAQVPLLVMGESAPARLSTLSLHGVKNLVCLDGIHYLRLLKGLELASLSQLTCLQGLESLVDLQGLSISHCPAVTELPSLCTLVNMKYLCIEDCVNLKSLEGCDKMGLLESANFQGCENLEHCPAVVERSSQYNCLPRLYFWKCKFASIKAMLGWVLDEKVSKVMFKASLGALAWELIWHLRKKPRERMELGEQLVETVGAYFTKKRAALNDDEFFDFQPWVDDLEGAWRYVCSRKWKGEAAPSFPRGMQRLMEGLSRVPLKSVLQQCQSDAPFRASLANCLLEIHHRVFLYWIIWGLEPRLEGETPISYSYDPRRRYSRGRAPSHLEGTGLSPRPASYLRQRGSL